MYRRLFLWLFPCLHCVSVVSHLYVEMLITAPTCVRNQAGLVYGIAVYIPDVQPRQAVTFSVRRARRAPRWHERMRSRGDATVHVAAFHLCSQSHQVAHRAAALPGKSPRIENGPAVFFFLLPLSDINLFVFVCWFKFNFFCLISAALLLENEWKECKCAWRPAS